MADEELTGEQMPVDETDTDSKPTPDNPEDQTADDTDAAATAADNDASGETGWRRVTASVSNMGLLGTLVLHYASRDVTVVVDGDAAMRIMKAAETNSARGLADVIDPKRSPASTGWVVLAPTQPLALSWFPGLPDREHAKAAFDPST